MNKCEICGRKTNRIYRENGVRVCSKHMHQHKKYGKFLDKNPRTTNDLNDYQIIDNEVYFNLYNVKSEKVGEFIIDLDDIEKVKYHKWRISHKHVVTGLPAKENQRDLAHIILDFNAKEDNRVVDHINGNPFDNRKSNLRICSHGDNLLNKSFMSNNTSGFIGVSYKKDRNTFDPEIRFQGVRCHLGCTKVLEEAVYKRYLAEKILFKEFANEEEQKRKFEFTEELSQKTKDKLYKIVESKLKAKNLWQ